MSSLPANQNTFLSVSPRFAVQDLQQALDFYVLLGFHIAYHTGNFAVVARDAITLHLNGFPDSPIDRHSVCWIAVTHVDDLYQRYLPTNAVCSPLDAKPWGIKEFMVRDPAGNGLVFAERISEPNAAV